MEGKGDFLRISLYQYNELQAVSLKHSKRALQVGIVTGKLWRGSLLELTPSRYRC